MNSKIEKTITDALTRLISFGIEIAFVWLVAMIFNPNIDSELIWFIAFLYAGVLNSILTIYFKVGK